MLNFNNFSAQSIIVRLSLDLVDRDELLLIALIACNASSRKRLRFLFARQSLTIACKIGLFNSIMLVTNDCNRCLSYATNEISSLNNAIRFGDYLIYL